MKPYLAYLQSEDWEQKKTMAILRCRGCCQRCGNQLTYGMVEVHHVGYSMNLKEIPISDLKPMCTECHQKVESKKINLPS